MTEGHGGRRRPDGQDDHLRQEPGPRRVHRRSASTRTTRSSRGTLRGSSIQGVTYAQSLIDDFSRNKAPHIAISVDMLDTGIDIPEIVNLVFFKQVRSKTKFWQMVGAAPGSVPISSVQARTRRTSYILDYCGNLEFFRQQVPDNGRGQWTGLNNELFGAAGGTDRRTRHGALARQQDDFSICRAESGHRPRCCGNR